MGVIYDTIHVPNPFRYEREFTTDCSEKHIVCEGARYHVLRYSTKGVRCSEPNCEINRSAENGEGDQT